MQYLAISISRGVTNFPDNDSFHVEELTPPTDAPDASLIKVDIQGNRIVHWWQSSRAKAKVSGPTLRAAAVVGPGGAPG